MIRPINANQIEAMIDENKCKNGKEENNFKVNWITQQQCTQRDHRRSDICNINTNIIPEQM